MSTLGSSVLKTPHPFLVDKDAVWQHNNTMMKATETLKWSGTWVLIAGTAVNGLNIYPLGVIMLALGGLLWLTAAVIVKDRPLIVTNLVMSLTGLAGVVYNLLIK